MGPAENLKPVENLKGGENLKPVENLKGGENLKPAENLKEEEINCMMYYIYL